VPQIPRPARDSRPGVAFQQGAGFRLEILIEFWRTSAAVIVVATVLGIRARSAAEKSDGRAEGALIESRSYVK